MKKKVFLMFFSFFIMFFLCTFSAEAAEPRPYVKGGVAISKDCGIYDVEKSNIEYADIFRENDEIAFNVTSDSWYSRTNPIISVYLPKYGLNSQALYHGAYKTIVIIFQITIKEEYDGYQEFYLIDSDENKNYLASPIISFEHGSGYQDGEYRRYEFYAEVPGKRFTSASFQLGFSAHGFGNNNWRFKDVRVQICLSNEQRKINNLLWVEDAQLDSL